MTLSLCAIVLTGVVMLTVVLPSVVTPKVGAPVASFDGIEFYLSISALFSHCFFINEFSVQLQEIYQGYVVNFFYILSQG
jgi:hypothetical protein